jgi:hypothetical protein
MKGLSKSLLLWLSLVVCTGCAQTITTKDPQMDQHQLTVNEQALIDREYTEVFKSPAEQLGKGSANMASAVGIESDLNKGHFFVKREDFEGVVEDEFDQFPLGFSAQYYLAQQRQKFPEIAVFDRNSKALICIYNPLNGFRWEKQRPVPNYRQTETGQNMALTHWHPKAYKHKKRAKVVN